MVCEQSGVGTLKSTAIPQIKSANKTVKRRNDSTEAILYVRKRILSANSKKKILFAFCFNPTIRCQINVVPKALEDLADRRFRTAQADQTAFFQPDTCERTARGASFPTSWVDSRETKTSSKQTDCLCVWKFAECADELDRLDQPQESSQFFPRVLSTQQRIYGCRAHNESLRLVLAHRSTQ